MYRLYAPVVSAVSSAFTVGSDVSYVHSAVIYTTGYSSASFAIYSLLLYRLYLRFVGLHRLHIWPVVLFRLYLRSVLHRLYPRSVVMYRLYLRSVALYLRSVTRVGSAVRLLSLMASTIK